MARRTKAWLTPDAGDTSVVRGCLEIPVPLLPMVTGALSALTEIWNWQAFGTMTPEDAAEAATRMLLAFEDGTCSDMNCEDVLDCVLPYLQANLYDDATIRLDPITEQPQVSYDGGTTWTDIPQSGNGTINAPQPQPTSGANDDAKICLAATRATLVLAEFYKQTFGAFTADVLNALGTANSFLQDIKLVLFNAIYSPYDGIVEAAGFLEQDFETNYTAGELSTGNVEDLLCLLVNNASVDTSGVVTFDFGAIADNVIADVGSNPGTALWFLLQNIQGAGLNAAASTAITSAPMDCSGCVEATCANYADDLATDLGDKTYLVPALGFNNAWGGTVTSGIYNTTGGRTGGGNIGGQGVGTFEGSSRVLAEALIDLGVECSVASVSFWHKEFRNNTGGNSAHIIYYNAAREMLRNYSTGVINESTTWRQVADSVAVEDVRYIRVYSGVNNPAVTTTYIDDIEVQVA